MPSLPQPTLRPLALGAGQPPAFPYRGRSMQGTFRHGDILVVEPVPWEAIRPGDVVAFRGARTSDDPIFIVHRVRARTPAGLITQGDNNRLRDGEPVRPESLVGRVRAVQRDKKTRPVRNGRAGRLWAGLLRLWRRARPLIGWPYRLLRASGVVRRLWRPRVTQVHVQTDAGPVVKYVCRGRTVAWWWPERGAFECRKPYDLALERPAPQAL